MQILEKYQNLAGSLQEKILHYGDDIFTHRIVLSGAKIE
jgi:hypothetical protein